MKTDNSNVARNFAKGIVSESYTGSFWASWDCKSLYSYSTKIASLKGGYLLMNCNGYSNTTKKHKSCIYHAYGIDSIIELPFVDADTQTKQDANMQYLFDRVTFCENKQKRAKKPFMVEYWTKEINHAITNVMRYSTLCNL